MQFGICKEVMEKNGSFFVPFVVRPGALFFCFCPAFAPFVCDALEIHSEMNRHVTKHRNARSLRPKNRYLRQVGIHRSDLEFPGDGTFQYLVPKGTSGLGHTK